MQPLARIRAICVIFALLLVPGIMQAEDVYLLTAESINGTTGSYTVPSNHQFTNSSGTVYTYTINSLPKGGFSFRIGVSGWGDNMMQPYKNDDPLTIDGDSYTISENCYGKEKAWKVSDPKGEYKSLTITVNLDAANRYVKITGVKSSTGGGSSTSGDESADNSDTESTTAGYGVPDKFGGVILRYNSSTEPTKGNLYDWKDYFSVAYLTPDSKGFKSTFAPYFSNLIKDVSSHSEKEDGWDGYVVSMSQSSHPLSLTAYGNPDFLIGNWSNSTSWSVGSELNYTKPYLEKINSSYAGMLDFPLRTFIYNIEQGKYSDDMAKGWQALTYLSQIAPTNNNRSSVVGSGRSNDAIYNRLGVTFVNNDKINDITGDENIKKAYAVILTAPGTPVVNYSDLANNDLNDDILRLIKIRQWAGVKNTSAFMTSEDKNYNNAYDYHIQGDFAELKVVVGDEAYVANYEKNGNSGETTGGTDDRNNAKFGGDGYNYTLLDEGTGWRVWYRNNNNTDAIHVAISPEGGLKTGTVNCTGQVIGIAGSGERKFAYTTDGTAPVLGASNTTMVTYTWNSTTQSGKIDDFSSTHPTVSANGGYVTVIAQAIKDRALVGALDTVTYRFTDYVPLAVKLTPPTATVPYGTSLTPKAEVINTTDATRRFAYTIDGTNPVINTKDASAGSSSTRVVTYTYDPVIPTSDLGTFYMAPGNVLAFIDHEGKTTTLTGTSVTVKAQAVQAVTSDGTTTYRLEGDIATGNYTFETAGVQPGTSYLLTVTNKEPISVNKATATVTVTNNTTNKDDGVDVYYTTDKTDPATSPTARLVRNRQITVYALPGTAGTEGTIEVAIPNTETKDSCKYDITYSTSEGGYQNYLVTGDTNQKTLGGKGHVVVYVQPYTTNESYTTSARQTYIYAYEKLADGSYASLTHAHRLLTEADKTTVKGDKGDTWYALDLEPASNYKEVNVLLGYYDGKAYKTTDATVANACQDMFLKFDVATGQITDVTHAYTGDHFYTTGTNGTKTEAANPSSTETFIYVQVPAAWVTKGNSVKVLNGTAEVGSVAVQGAAETSDLSRFCKITGLTSITDGTQLTIKPYKGSTAGRVSFTISYKNGGYYYYESSGHNSPEARLVFSADADTDRDYRSKGHRDINHVTTGDKTNYLANSWTYTPEPASKTSETKSIADNWNKAASATVNVIPSGTTISQEVTGLTASTPYTVQMIVRGKSGAKGTMTLKGATTTTDELTLTGYDAQGVVTSDGRVEYLLNNDTTKNGWQKLEATANASAEGKLTISLAAVGEEMQLSDVTLLENANTKGHVWTTAPTSNETTEYDLSERATANAFSFFDRGKNRNAIIYANANTVLGMSKNTYDVAVGDGSNFTMQTLALTDQAQDGTTASGDVAKFYASGWNYGVTKDFTASAVQFDRTFSAGVKAAVCFPFALDKDKMESMFGTGAKAYTVTAVDANKLIVTAEEATSGIAANTPCLLEPGSGYKTSNKLTGSFKLTNTSGVSLSASAGTEYTFEGTYDYKKVSFNDKEHCYSFDPTLNGRFKYVSKSKGGIIKPFRAYIKEANTAAHAKVFRLVINSTTTGLVDAELNEVSTAPIYSVTGVLVSANGNRNGLPNGVYIQDGKKFVINK